MNNYFIKKHDLEVKKVTKVGNITIITTPLDQFVLKDSNINIYKYLLSRGFDYFPRIIDYTNETIMFHYEEKIEYDIEQKVLDYIRLLSLLNSKTIYFKEVEENYFYNIYDKYYNRLIDINNYYMNLISNIESKEYMSPCEYLVSRNISNIFYIINYSINTLKDWYEKVKESTKVRVSTLYNNINLNNMIKNSNGMYLTSFNNTTIENPILDLLNLYNKYYQIIDLDTILKTYEKVLKLNDEEKELFYILAFIPNKIIINNKVDGICSAKKEINKIIMSIKILNSKKEEATSTHQEEDNK